MADNEVIINEIVRKFFPIVFDEGIISEEDVSNSYQQYLNIRKDIVADIPMYFYDYLLCAYANSPKSREFLKLYQEKLRILLNNESLSKVKLNNKIRESVLTTSPSGYPNCKDHIAELLLFEKLCGINGEECIGIDFPLGNRKDTDIAFIKNKKIQLIEIISVHNPQKQDILELLRNKIDSKLNKKTKLINNIKNHFASTYPNHDVTFTILPFIWEDTFEIDVESKKIIELVDSYGDDLLPPMTLMCEKVNDGEEYKFQLCELSHILDRIKEQKSNKNE